MRIFVISLIVTMLAVPGAVYAQSSPSGVLNFKKLDKQDIAIVDQDGVERIGQVISVTERALIVNFPSGPQTFEQEKIFRIERMHDRNTDGFIKGASIALLITILAAPGYESGSTAVYATAYTMALFGGVGYVFDRMSDNRQRVYQAPRKPAEKKIAANLVKLKF